MGDVVRFGRERDARVTHFEVPVSVFTRQNLGFRECCEKEVRTRVGAAQLPSNVFLRECLEVRYYLVFRVTEAIQIPMDSAHE